SPSRRFQPTVMDARSLEKSQRRPSKAVLLFVGAVGVVVVAGLVMQRMHASPAAPPAATTAPRPPPAPSPSPPPAPTPLVAATALPIATPALATTPPPSATARHTRPTRRPPGARPQPAHDVTPPPAPAPAPPPPDPPKPS